MADPFWLLLQKKSCTGKLLLHPRTLLRGVRHPSPGEWWQGAPLSLCGHRAVRKGLSVGQWGFSMESTSRGGNSAPNTSATVCLSSADDKVRLMKALDGCGASSSEPPSLAGDTGEQVLCSAAAPHHWHQQGA